MPSPKRSLWTRGAWPLVVALLSGIATFAAAWFALISIIRVDPFAAVRDRDLAMDEGLVLEQVEFTIYDGERLEAAGFVDQISVRRDRSETRLIGVRDTRLYSENRVVQLAAPWVRWRNATGDFEGLEGATVTGEDFRLSVPGFSFHPRQSLLVAEGGVAGTLLGGEFSAQSVRYLAGPGRLEFGPAAWVGQAELPAGGRRTWTFESRGPSTTQGDITTMRDCTARDAETVIFADLVEWNQRTDVLTATGNVRYFGIDANLLCDRVVVFRREGRAVLTGNVTMLIKPEDSDKPVVEEIRPLRPVVPEQVAVRRPATPVDDEQAQLDEQVRSDENLRRHPVQITAERIEYWFRRGSRRAIITGSPQARQDLPGMRWRMVWAERAVYDGERERLRLYSREGTKNARLKTSIGDDLRATLWEISTRRGDDFRYAENLEGVTVVDEDEIPELPGEDRGRGGQGQGAPLPPRLTGPIGG